MLLYAHTITPRLKYVAHFLSSYYQHPFTVTANEAAFTASADFKINYSHHRIGAEELYIKPCPILSESEKRRFTLHSTLHNGYKVFFETSGDLGFDLFAGIFYLLSRYEEYLPHPTDTYGRFAHTHALAWHEEFLHLPLVNIWLEDFRLLLQHKFEGIWLATPTFSFEPTYDIDVAWCYKHKPFKIRTARLLQALVTAKFGQARRQLQVRSGALPDPFDAYDWMDTLHQRYGLEPIYFFLAAEQKGRYDRNIDVQVPEFTQLIQQTAARYPVGVHPSWASGEHPSLIQKEKAFLEKAGGRPIHASRQHYIRVTLPRTYQLLLENGITDDYSMGYGSVNGFRASVATPFYWYDLEREQQTSLRVHPFCFMDANAFYEQQLSAEAALDTLLEYTDEVKKVGGTLSTIWHNQFLGTADAFAGWRDVYERFVTAVVQPPVL